MLAVGGLALPTILILSDEMVKSESQRQYVDKNGDGVSDIVDGPTESMLGFSRLNASIMVLGYVLYLLFQLGTHQEEFEDDEGDDGDAEEGVLTKGRTRRNKFCGRFFGVADEQRDDLTPLSELYQRVESCPNNTEEAMEIEMLQCQNDSHHYERTEMETTALDDTTVHSSNISRKRSNHLQTRSNGRQRPLAQDAASNERTSNKQPVSTLSSKSHCSDGSVEEEEPSSVLMIPVSEVQEQFKEGKL